MPVTSDDLIFTARADQERQVPGFGNVANTLIERVEAPDAATFVVTWKEPFVGADSLFTRIRGLPLPRHILEEPYNENKVAVPDHPYWGHQFVGTGPYKLRELVSGSHLILDANDRFVLGRPKIDVFEVKFAPDANVLITNILANAAEMTMGARLSIDQALQIQDGWREGAMLFSPGGWLVAMPQFLNPDPTAAARCSPAPGAAARDRPPGDRGQHPLWKDDGRRHDGRAGRAGLQRHRVRDSALSLRSAARDAADG